MKNRPETRIKSIETMGNELVSLNIMADSVGLEVRNLTERWASLEEKVTKNSFHVCSYLKPMFFFNIQAKAKAEWLENRARGAQQCEQRLVQLHNAITSIDAELCSSLEQDLNGVELPDLCQVRISTSAGSLFRLKTFFTFSLFFLANRCGYRTAGGSSPGNPPRRREL